MANNVIYSHFPMGQVFSGLEEGDVTRLENMALGQFNAYGIVTIADLLTDAQQMAFTSYVRLLADNNASTAGEISLELPAHVLAALVGAPDTPARRAPMALHKTEVDNA